MSADGCFSSRESRAMLFAVPIFPLRACVILTGWCALLRESFFACAPVEREFWSVGGGGAGGGWRAMRCKYVCDGMLMLRCTAAVPFQPSVRETDLYGVEASVGETIDERVRWGAAQ